MVPSTARGHIGLHSHGMVSELWKCLWVELRVKEDVGFAFRSLPAIGLTAHGIAIQVVEWSHRR